jgi:hypothetical protein
VLTGGQSLVEPIMTRVALAALSALGAGLLLASAAQAQAPAQSPAPAAPPADQGGPNGGQGGGWRHGGGGPMGGMREACSADMKTYCGDAGQDRDARRQCMTQHKAQFSQGCQEAIAKMQAWRQSHPRPEGQGQGQGQGPQ